MGGNSERLAKRIMVAQNIAYGCLFFSISITCFDRVDIYVCLYGAMNNYPGGISMGKNYKRFNLSFL